MGKLIVTINSRESIASLKDSLNHSLDKGSASRLDAVLNGPVTSLVVQNCNSDDVAASGTITFSGVGQALDTILINGVTFTARASGAVGNEWNVGASAAASATALKTAINASASALVSGHVTASDNGAGVITLTAIKKGVNGNAITLAEGVDGLTHMAVSGARLTGGVNESASEATYSYLPVIS